MMLMACGSGIAATVIDLLPEDLMISVIKVHVLDSEFNEKTH